MSVSLSNSKDITVNRINLIQPNGTVVDLMSDVISNIEGGLTEDQLQTMSDISVLLIMTLFLLTYKIKLTTNKIY